MTKLYYHPHSSAAASFIAAVAAGVHIEVEQIDFATKKTTSGADFFAINPKGNVPALVLNDGTVLNEGSAVLQYIADQAPGTVASENGTTQRYILQNVLNYLASEVASTLNVLCSETELVDKEALKVKFVTKFEYLEKNILHTHQYLVDDKFSVADAYLYILLRAVPYVGVDLSAYPGLIAFSATVGALPAVVEAHAKMNADASST
eukprot:gene10206-11945_t